MTYLPAGPLPVAIQIETYERTRVDKRSYDCGYNVTKHFNDTNVTSISKPWNFTTNTKQIELFQWQFRQ